MPRLLVTTSVEVSDEIAARIEAVREQIREGHRRAHKRNPTTTCPVCKGNGRLTLAEKKAYRHGHDLPHMRAGAKPAPPVRIFQGRTIELTDEQARITRARRNR